MFRFPTHFNDCKAKQNCQLHRTHVARSLFAATVGGRQAGRSVAGIRINVSRAEPPPPCLSSASPSLSLCLSAVQPDLATDADGSAAPRLDLSPVSCIVAQAIACPRSSVHSPPPLLFSPLSLFPCACPLPLPLLIVAESWKSTLTARGQRNCRSHCARAAVRERERERGGSRYTKDATVVVATSLLLLLLLTARQDTKNALGKLALLKSNIEIPWRSPDPSDPASKPPSPRFPSPLPRLIAAHLNQIIAQLKMNSTHALLLFFFNVQFCFLFLLIFVARTLQKFAMCLLSSSSPSSSSSSSLLWFCFLTLFLILYKIFVVYCCFLIRR